VDSNQPSFTDVEYGNRRRVSRREQFLETMNATIPWARWVGLIEPHYYSDRPGKRGRKPKPIETMLRMYLLQVWFSLSDEGVEEAIYDSYAMRRFMGLDFGVEQVPDATTLLHFRHLLEKHQLGEKLLEARTRSSRRRAGSCAGARSWMPRSSPRRPRRRTPPVSVTLRCTRPRRATSGTSG
jgi:transposase, IS5 family